MVNILDAEILNTANRGLSQTYCLRQEHTKDIEGVSTYWPERKDEALEAKYSKLGAGLIPGLSISFSNPRMDTIGTVVQAIGPKLAIVIL